MHEDRTLFVRFGERAGMGCAEARRGALRALAYALDGTLLRHEEDAHGAAARSSGDEDVVDFLLAQHREAEQLFAEVTEGTAEARRHALEHLVQLLAVHETAEEEVVYPALRTTGDEGDRIADARTAEEDEAKRALSDLECTDLASPEFDAKLRGLQQLVLAHATNEEHEVFPRLRQTQSPERLQQMREAVRAAEAVAPTHPHPHGPESAVGNVVLGPFVAVVDRVRDAMRKARGKTARRR